MVDKEFLEYLDEITSQPIKKSRLALESLLKDGEIVNKFKNEIVLWLGRPDREISETMRNFIYLNEDMHFVESPNLPHNVKYYGNSNAFVSAIKAERLSAEEIGVVFRSLITTQNALKTTDEKAVQLITNSGVTQKLRERLYSGELTLLDAILFLGSKELETNSKCLITSLSLDADSQIIYVVPKGEWQENVLLNFLEKIKTQYKHDYIYVFFVFG